MFSLKGTSLALALATVGCTAVASDGTQGDNDPTPQGIRGKNAEGYTATKYPWVLSHGLWGWVTIHGHANYWYGIVEDLKAGGAQVFTTEVTGANSAEVRGEQLITQIEQILAQTGAAKVNLLGHSQGGVDVRYVLGVRPDLLASVTAVAGPEKGADMADFILDHIAPGGFSEEVTAAIGNGLASVIDWVTGKTLSTDQDFLASLNTLSAKGAAVFNARYPAGIPDTACGQGTTMAGDIPLYSWIGTTTLTNWWDPSDLPFALTSLAYDDASDGLVGRCSSHFGKVLRDDYVMNHLDEINQFAGLVSDTEVNPVTVFRNHANRIKNLGL